MKTAFTKNEKIFSAITLLVVAGFFTAFKTIHFKSSDVSQIDTVEAIDYKMARPEQGYAGYSLEGREIDENYEAIQAKKIAAEKAKITAAKKAKEQAKKAETKKTEAKVAKAQSADKSNAVNHDKNTSQKSNLASANSTNDYYAYANNRIAAAAVAQDAKAVDTKNTEDKKNKKSFSQWRSEIYATPTKETMTSFITAFRKGELTATEYQAMAQDLLDQNDANLKGLGLMALRSQPSLASLSQLVHIEASLPAQLQTYVQQSYLAYFQPQNVQILNQALMTKDKTLVVKSLNLLTANLQKIKTGDIAGFTDARARRELSSESVSLNNFKVLLPSLAALVSAQEQDVSVVARQVVGLIS